MEIIRINSPHILHNTDPAAVALGNFDGVHRAHRRLLQQAAEAPLVTAVFTFEEEAPSYLTPLAERLLLLEACGVEKVFLAPFSAFRSLSCEEFVAFLHEKLACSLALCGFNFRFGKGAVGHADTLRALGAPWGMDVWVCPEQLYEGQTISSSRIRALLEAGEVEKAAALLGRPYAVSGEVVHGFSLGKRLKTPTLNLPLASGRVMLKNGVYASCVLLDGKRYPAVTNIGCNPTFQRHQLTCETHLLEASGDFYGKHITVIPERFLRCEKTFSSPQALAEAIAEDVKNAKRHHGLL